MRGAYGWIVVAAIIVLIDLIAPDDETLSATCWRALKRQPATVVVLVSVTALHLLLGHHPRYSKIDIYRALEEGRHHVRRGNFRQAVYSVEALSDQNRVRVPGKAVLVLRIASRHQRTDIPSS